MNDKKTFSEMMDRSKLDRLEGEFLGLAAEMEGKGYHTIDIVNALQSTIESRLKRDLLEETHYWKKMKFLADNYHKHGEIWKEEVQERRNKERKNDQEKGRKNKRGQTLN